MQQDIDDIKREITNIRKLFAVHVKEDADTFTQMTIMLTSINELLTKIDTGLNMLIGTDVD